MRAWNRIMLGALLAVAAAHAAAQAYPTKRIRWIIDFPAAGVSDILARTVGQKLSENLGQPIVYDNRPGANGIIANELFSAVEVPFLPVPGCTVLLDLWVYAP